MSDSQQTFPRIEDGPRFSGEFVPVAWRGTTFNAACQKDAVGVSFNSQDGGVIRLLMTRESAKQTADSLLEAYQRWVEFASFHSDSSSGKPSVAVSTPEECEKV